jgi:hypothetical protein
MPDDLMLITSEIPQPSATPGQLQTHFFQGNWSHYNRWVPNLVFLLQWAWLEWPCLEQQHSSNGTFGGAVSKPQFCGF